MTDTPRFIFLDLETTGLNSQVDDITEAAWILDDGTERHFFVQHWAHPNEWVRDHTDYLTRIAPAEKSPLVEVLATLRKDAELMGKPYLVGACPSFDDRFLREGYADFNTKGDDEPPYHYHLIDVETYAMGFFGLLKPPRLKDLRAALGLEGENPAPHTALADAREVRLIFQALQRASELRNMPF